MGSKDADPSLGYLTRKDTEVKLPRPTRVKNKTPAPIQITAEQILREARERQEAEIRPPKQKITDSTELADYRLRKRKEFEDLIRRVRWNTGVWIKYAKWEESQKDFNRARSVWERALEVDYRNHTLWLKYAEVEMKNKFINHARNVWDRAVTLLPRVDQLWYKYIHMEEMLGNVAGARQIFERWMHWMPDQQGWLSYIKFELRYNEVERARQIYERFVQCHPKVSTWIKYAKFEMKMGEVDRARNVYEHAVEKLADDEEAEQLFVAFAEFEERCKETERARCIYKFALDHIPKGRAEDLYRKFVAFEKQYGDREGIEDAIVGKRRFQYEDEAYIDFEISQGEYERTRALYERLLDRTKHLKVWISYAKFEGSATGEDGGNPDMPEDDFQEHLYEQKKQCIQRARRVFEKAINYYRTSAPELKEERAMLLEEWLNMESSFGELGDVSLVQAKLPKKLKKRRQTQSDDGLSAGYEEYIDYLFPEESQTTNLKILEAAYKWKKQKIVSDDE
ncbi:Crooked neck protein [Citrus sinensis]|nr:Crooked neck protein [Citrus sinensis]